jgi:hypothetical protein
MLGYDDPEGYEWRGVTQQPQAELVLQQDSDSDVNGSPEERDPVTPRRPRCVTGETEEQRHYFGTLSSQSYHKEEFKVLDAIFQGCFAARLLLLLVATGCVIAMMFFINVPNCDRTWYADEEQWCYMHPGWKQDILSVDVRAAESDSRADLEVEYPLLVLQAGRTNACSGLELMEAMPRVPQKSCHAGNLLGVFVWELTETGRIVYGILFFLAFIVVPCATKSRALQVAREHFRLEHCSLWPFNAESLGLLFITISHSLALNLLYLPFTSISLVNGAQDWFVLRSYEMVGVGGSISNPFDTLVQATSFGLLRGSFLLILVAAFTVPKSFQRTYTEISILRYMKRQCWSILVLSISLYNVISMLTKMGISCALGIDITLVFTFEFSIGIVGCAAVLRFALLCDTLLCFSMLVMNLCAVKVPELGGLTNLRGHQSRTPVGLWFKQSENFKDYQIIQSKSDIEYNDGTVIPQGSLGMMYFCTTDMHVVREGRELSKRCCVICGNHATEFDPGFSMRVDWRNGIKMAQVLPKHIDHVTVRGLAQCPLCNPHVEREGVPDSQCDMEAVHCDQCVGWFWALKPEGAEA